MLLDWVELVLDDGLADAAESVLDDDAVADAKLDREGVPKFDPEAVPETFDPFGGKLRTSELVSGPLAVFAPAAGGW
jgi:hypothetical protein